MLAQDQIEFLTRLFQNRYGFILGAIRLYVSNPNDIDDLVQDVYLSFLQGAEEERWDLSRDLGPILYQIAKRKGQLYWRRRQQKAAHELKTVTERLVRHFEETGESDLKEHEIDEIRSVALNECLEVLPEKSRKIVQMHYFDSVAMKEIAEQNQLKLTTIYHFFSRIRVKLRECIERKLKTS